MTHYRHYQLLADLFKYPSIKLVDKAVECQNLLEKEYPEAAQTLERFVNFTLNSPLYAIEEVYTKTFHIQAICYLDLGYVMFGEDYKRGEFLVNMKREQKDAANDCGTELPDNLVNVLTLLPKLKDQDFIDELTVRIIIPSLRKMLAEFDASKMALKTKLLKKKHKAIIQENLQNGNIYQKALKALLMVFENDFAGKYFEEEKEPAYTVNPFITNCGTSCSIGTAYKNTMS